MDRMETREMEQFLAVAEELSFTGAAERLGMTQPPLSRAVARLERRIGVRLLERTSRRVVLTPAGEVVSQECRRLLRELDTVTARARRAAEGDRLALAVRPGMGTDLLLRLLSAAESHQPEIVFTHDQAAAVRHGLADLALLCRETDDLSGLETTEVGWEDPVALLPADHALADGTAVMTDELRIDPRWRERCPPVGLDEILDRVALGKLITIAGSATARRLIPGVVAVPVSDLPTTVLVLGWPNHLARPAATTFARRARLLAADTDLPT
ncbi:LysR family transcriptional regulator [Streptomyces sp. NPDC026672]|uniref:LysR family transcriptional regulator n=1 Tax=unclassified Streptomyces TaxID=2593676 RepID=UPI0033F1693C